MTENRILRKAVPLLMFLLIITIIFPPLHAYSSKRVKKNSIKLYEEDYYNLLMMIDKSVKLPLNELNVLLEKIRKAEETRKKRKEGVERLRRMSSYSKYNFTGGKMTCRVSDSNVTVDLQLGLNLRTAGWKEIPLKSLPGLDSIKIGGADAALKKSGGKGQFSIITDRTGKTMLSVRYHPKIERRKKGNLIYSAFRVELNQRTPVDVLLTLPMGGRPTTGFRAKTKFKMINGRWTTTLKTDFTRPLKVEWYVPRKERDDAAEGRYTTDIRAYFIAADKMIRCASLVKIDIYGNHVAEVPLTLPSGFRLIDKELPDGVSVSADDRGSKLVIVLDEEAGPTAQLILFAEARMEEAELKLLPPSSDGARREVGFVAIRGEDIRIDILSNGSFQPIDTRMLPQELVSLGEEEPDKGFKYVRSEKSIEPLHLRLSERITFSSIDAYVRKASYYTSLSSDGILMTEAQITLINNNKQFLKLTLPDGARILSALVGSSGVKPVTDKEGRILIPIRPKKHSRDGLVKVTFVISKQVSPLNEDGIEKIELPKLDLPVNKAAVKLFLPKGYEYEEFEGSMKLGVAGVQLSQYISDIPVITDHDIGSSKEFEMPEDEEIDRVSEEKEYVTKRMKRKPAASISSISADKGQADLSGDDAATGKSDARFKDSSKVAGIAQTREQGLTYDENRVKGALSLTISIPKEGKMFEFHDFLVIDEKPFITFEYEKE